MKIQIVLQIPSESILAIARTLSPGLTGIGSTVSDNAARDRVLKSIITQAYFPNCFRKPELEAVIENERHIRSRRMPKSKRTVV